MKMGGGGLDQENKKETHLLHLTFVVAVTSSLGISGKLATELGLPIIHLKHKISSIK